MMQLLIATTNAGKRCEIESVLKDLPIARFLTLDMLKPAPSTWPEEGFTFSENALGKALHYSGFFDGLTLAEDSGLEVQYLEGGPGIYSARFGGEHVSYREKNRMLLRLMERVPEEARRARFHCVMALARRGVLFSAFEGTVEGRIAHESRGEGGFGYDPVFFYPPFGKTFGEIGLDEKNRVSHRAMALHKLRLYLESSLARHADRLQAAP
jgi:XTP/dITP diphosphohydrolase